MPVWIRRSMFALNGAIGVIFAALTFTVLSKGILATLVVGAVPVAAVANIYIINKTAILLSDEEWWKSRIRVLELQQQAAAMERELHASTQGQRPPLVALPPPESAKAE